MSTHEDFSRAEAEKLPSNRSFGLVFATVFLIVGLGPLVRHGGIRWWALILAAGFLILGVMNSPLLTPLNRVWMKFGLLLHHIVSPLILGAVFFTVVLAIGWIRRLLGKDSMQRRFDKEATSYWILRDPPGPARQSMKNQF